MRPEDPNFVVQYRLIHDVDYMEIDSDPDMVEPFPTLLPLPVTIDNRNESPDWNV